MIPKPSESLQDLINTVNELKKENEKLKKKINDLIGNIKPLRVIYHEGGLAGWNRHYHYDEEFIERHINQHKFHDEGNVGYILTKKPTKLKK